MNFVDFTLIFFLAFLFGYLVNLLRQPPLIGYIIAGAILGNIFQHQLGNISTIEELSHLGIAFLMYIVGLHLNSKEIKEMGFKPMLIGLLQVLITSIVSFVILINFVNIVTTIILSVAISFSSTILIVKIISDKGEIDELYSKILIAILLIQDIFVAIFLIAINSFTLHSKNFVLAILFLLFKLIGIIVVLKLFVDYVLEKMLDQIAKNQELMFLFSVVWCFLIGTLFSLGGFSLELGSLIAGILLASSTYQPEMSSRIKPLRDFFIVLFFLLLGLKIRSISSGDIILIEILLLVIFILKPIVSYYIIKFFKYPVQVSFLSSISLGQVSAFSIIIIFIASQNHLIPSDIETVMTVVIIFTMAISSYLIKYNFNLFYFLVKLGIIKYKSLPKGINKEESPSIIIFGYDRIGFSLFSMIKKLNKSYLIVDFNPAIIEKLKRNHINSIYGDVSDIDLLESINFEKTKILISTIPNFEISKLILKYVKNKNKDLVIILTSHKIQESLELYNLGADYVILPHFLGGEYIATFLENNYDNIGELLKEKIKHISELQKRKKEGFEHPEYKKNKSNVNKK